MTMTVSDNTLAWVAGLIGDPARANILSALIDGRRSPRANSPGTRA